LHDAVDEVCANGGLTTAAGGRHDVHVPVEEERGPVPEPGSCAMRFGRSGRARSCPPPPRPRERPHVPTQARSLPMVRRVEADQLAEQLNRIGKHGLFSAPLTDVEHGEHRRRDRAVRLPGDAAMRVSNSVCRTRRAPGTTTVS
jgi:hypothetical protein